MFWLSARHLLESRLLTWLSKARAWNFFCFCFECGVPGAAEARCELWKRVLLDRASRRGQVASALWGRAARMIALPLVTTPKAIILPITATLSFRAPHLGSPVLWMNLWKNDLQTRERAP